MLQRVELFQRKYGWFDVFATRICDDIYLDTDLDPELGETTKSFVTCYPHSVPLADRALYPRLGGAHWRCASDIRGAPSPPYYVL